MAGPYRRASRNLPLHRCLEARAKPRRLIVECDHSRDHGCSALPRAWRCDAASAMTWRVLRLERSLGEWADLWDALNTKLTGGNPILDKVFVERLLACFGTGDEWLCMLEKGGETSAMCIVRRHRPGVWSSFLPAQAQLGATLVREPQDLQDLPDVLPGLVMLVDLLCNDPRVGRLHQPGQLPMTLQRHAITMAIHLTGSFDDYWRRRPKKLRANIRRYEHRAEDNEGHLQFLLLTDLDAVQQGLHRYAALEGLGWKAKEGTDLASTKQQFDFYSRIMAHHAARGQAVVAELWHQGHLAASRLVIIKGGFVIALKSTFDESKRAWAPGRVMLRRFVEAAFDRWPEQQLEFYTDASADQLEWAGSQRSIFDLSVYKNSVAATVGSIWYRLRGAHGRSRLAGGLVTDPRELVRVHREVASLSESAKALLALSEQRNVEYGPGWLDVHARTVMRGSSGVRFLSLQRGPLAVAVLACNVDRSLGALGCRVGALSSFYSSSWSPAVVERATSFALTPLLSQLRIESKNCPKLWFSPMDPSSVNYALLREALRMSSYSVFEEFAHGNWYLPVAGSYAHYLASRSGLTRTILTRAQKKAASSGIRLELLVAPVDMARGLAAFAQVYAHSWKRAEPIADFIAEVARMCAERGWLRLGLAWLADEPIATQLWIVSHGRAAIVKLAYDERHKHFGAGNALTGMMMKHSIDVDAVREIDYLVGDDPYKQQWMTHRREMKSLVACNQLHPMGQLLTIRHRLAQIPWIHRLWMRSKSLWKRLSSR